MTEAAVEHVSGQRLQADRSARLALIVFAAVEAAALPLILVLGHYRWFFFDEWDFLAGRTGGDLGDLFRPHDQHWSTLPILAYRALWWLVGLRSYVPYQVLIVVLHLTAAALLRVVMRRAGVGPWIATAAASLFALLGAGNENIVWAFQINFVGSLVFGLTHLLLADHDGPVDRRDALGLLAGVAGLMCSGVAVTMVVVVGLATLIRRGWRVAALHTAPLAALFVGWLLTSALESYAGRSRPGIGTLVRFVTRGIANAFADLGQVPGAGVALGILLPVGLVVAWGPLTSAERRRCAAAPAALLVGAILFLLNFGLGHPIAARAPQFAASGRYIHLVSALALPAVAVAADAVARRFRVLMPAMLALLLIGVPGNVKAFVDHAKFDPIAGEQFQRAYKKRILSIARLPASHEVPRWVRPEPFLAPDLTVGWLLDGVASGRVPQPGPIDPVLAANLTLGLALDQSRANSVTQSCRTLASPVTRRIDKGQSIVIDAGVLMVVYLDNGGAASHPRRFDSARGRKLVALAGPLMLQLSSADNSKPVMLCG